MQLDISFIRVAYYGLILPVWEGFFMKHSAKRLYRHQPETFTVCQTSQPPAPPRPWWQRFSIELLMLAVLVFMSLWGGYLYLRMRALTIRQELISLYATTNERKPKAVRLQVQNRLDVPIREATPTANHWTIARSAASHLAQSANPGEPGNIIIYGHTGRAVFGGMKDVSIGTIIILTTEENRRYEYVVAEIRQTDPDHLEPLAPTTEEQLTIYTTAGLFGTKRLIIQAHPTQSDVSFLSL